MARQERASALVIGAGAAGAVVSLELARRGVAVVCLEQGDWEETHSFPTERPDWELWASGRYSADPNVRRQPSDYPIANENAEVSPLLYNAVGGSTILYNAVFPRMLPTDFAVRSLDGVADDWPLSYQDLEPYYRQAEQQFRVSGLTGDPAYGGDAEGFPFDPLPIGSIGRRIARAHNRLGWHWWPQANAIASGSDTALHRCSLLGACTVGCSRGAKASVDITHWPEAVRRGVDLRVRTRATRIVTDARGLATGVDYLDEDGKLQHQTADIVILAANAIGTARLLMLSGNDSGEALANSSGLVGKRLMVHPAARVHGFFDDERDSWRGQFGGAITSLQFYDTPTDKQHMRGAKWTLTPGSGPVRTAARLAGAGLYGRQHQEAFSAQFGRGAAWSMFAEDLPEEHNQVTLAPDRCDSGGVPGVTVNYTMSENTRRILEYNTTHAVASLLEAGADTTETELYTKAPGWHAMGTARMGDDPSTSVVNRYGRTHDIKNLYIADASVFVTGGAVNPTNTLAALALRMVDHLLRGRADQEVPL